MEISQIIPHIEALIFASEKPLGNEELMELVNNALGFIEDRANVEQVQAAVDAVREKYDSEFYPFELRESGGGYQFLTKREFHKTVALLNGDKFMKRLSSAAMETLAIIAYKQPITKGEIESIRGVNSDYAVQKLLEKELVIISGRNEEMPGKPLIYNTSKGFMDYFGINSADELPKIREVLAEQLIPTTVAEAYEGMETETEETETKLAVDDNGELIVEQEKMESTEEVDATEAHDVAEEELADEIENDATEDLDEMTENQQSDETTADLENEEEAMDEDETKEKNED
jgi:segregation and condensation protein B